MERGFCLKHPTWPISTDPHFCILVEMESGKAYCVLPSLHFFQESISDEQI